MKQNPFFKFLAFFAITFVLTSLFTYVGPWWLIIIAPLLLGFFFKITQFHAFLMGAFSIIIYWGFYLFSIPNTETSHILEFFLVFLQLLRCKSCKLFSIQYH